MSEDGGQTNDGPLVYRGQAPIRSRVFGSSVSPDRGSANRDEVSPIDDGSLESQVHGPGSSARQIAVDLAGDVALRYADGLTLRATVFDAAPRRGLGPRVRSQPGDHDVPQRPVGLAVPATVETVPGELAR